MENRILLVEDDPVLGRSLSVNLELEGYAVSWVRDIFSAVRSCENEKHNLLLVDVGLPDGNGIDFLRNLRQRGSKLPIIVLTARIDEDTAVESLHFGANDFIRKPFGSRELMARIKRALNEPMFREEQIVISDLVLLPQQRKLMCGPTNIELNRREYDILLFLAQNVEKVVSRESLIAAIGGSGDLVDRTVDSHMSHIRAKFKRHAVTSVKISSIYGIGYKLEKAC